MTATRLTTTEIELLLADRRRLYNGLYLIEHYDFTHDQRVPIKAAYDTLRQAVAELRTGKDLYAGWPVTMRPIDMTPEATLDNDECVKVYDGAR